MQKTDTEEGLAEELLVLATQYSLLRRCNLKWQSRVDIETNFTTTTPNNVICNLGLSSAQEKHISLENLNGTIDTYKVQDLLMRVAIKRFRHTFELIHAFWSDLKLASTSMMSQELYLRVVSMCVKEWHMVATASDIYWDLQLDFMDKVGLTFCEFYDSFFELLDCAVQSQVYNDYVLALSAIRRALKVYRIRNASMQVADAREPYHDWMFEIMGADAPKRTKVQICNECRAKKVFERQLRPKSVMIKRVDIGTPNSEPPPKVHSRIRRPVRPWL